MSHVDQLLSAAGLRPNELRPNPLRTRVLLIGPKEAEALLCANKDNRPLRPGRVAYYCRAMLNGEWMLTHQGIAFSKTGRGLDLQHRMRAVVESGMTVPFLVVEGLDDAAFAAIDLHERRSMVDVTGLPKELVEEARLAISFMARSGNNMPTPEETRDVAVELEAASSELQAICPTKRKLFSTATVRLACITLMTEHPGMAKQIANAYQSLVLHRYEEWSPPMQSLAKQAVEGKVRNGTPSEKADLFVRCLMVFNNEHSGSTRLIVKGDPLEQVRERMRSLFENKPAASPAA